MDSLIQETFTLTTDAINSGKPLLCVDFDGVIHRYSKGFHDGTIYDCATEGAREWLNTVKEYFSLVIYSARARSPEGRAEISEFMKREGLPDLPVTCVKPPAFLTLDDRAMTFTGAFPTVYELNSFTPWHKTAWGACGK